MAPSNSFHFSSSQLELSFQDKISKGSSSNIWAAFVTYQVKKVSLSGLWAAAPGTAIVAVW